MTEEEKKAIEILKDYVTNIEQHHFEKSEGFECVKIVLSLLEKQQKEIERLKQEIKDITSIPEGDENYE